MGLPIVGVVAGAKFLSSLFQASAVSRQAKRNQRIADINAKYADHDAWEAEKFGYTLTARYATTINAVIGKQKVGFAAQNVDVSSGTAKAIQEETKLTGFLNTLDMQKAGHMKALGLKRKAFNLRLGGEVTKRQGELDARGIVVGGLLGVGSTLTGYFGLSTVKESPSAELGGS